MKAKALLILTLAACAQAQPPSIAEQEATRAQLLLHSNELANKAWGAYFAGRLHAADLNAQIIEELRAASGMAGSRSGDVRAYVASLFDAAIVSGAAVPADVLVSFEQTWAEPVIVLLSISRARDREEMLLRMADARSDVEWVAANNLLLRMKSRKWYGKTLGAMRPTQRITVLDPDGAAPVENGIGSGACGDSLIDVPKGFPPVTFYSLETGPQAGLTLAAPGPVNVYYRRTTVVGGGHGGIGSCFSVDRAQQRIAYLADLAKMPAAEVEKLFHGETLVRYQGAEEFRREAAQALDAQEHAIRGLIETVQEREHMSASGVALEIAPEVRDLRRNRTEDLPGVGPREIAFR